MKPPIPKNTFGLLTNTANNQTRHVKVVDYELHDNILYHKVRYLMADGSYYGGGSVNLDDDYFSFTTCPSDNGDDDDDQDNAVCADHE